MLKLLRRIGSLALGLALALSLVHVPAGHASEEPGIAHHEGDAHPAMATPQADGATDCRDCAPREHEAPCDDAHAVGCAALGACPVSMAESAGTPSPLTLSGGAVAAQRVTEPLSAHRAPETPPPRA